MDRSSEYVAKSLEQHLFFARIMKEHAFFLKVGFLPPNENFARQAAMFLRQFEALLSRSIALSCHVVGNRVLRSGELVTEFTQQAEEQTQRLTGTALNRRLTVCLQQLQGCDCGEVPCVSQSMIRQVRQLNRDGLRLVNGLIDWKGQLLECVGGCRMFTNNYPLLITHIRREACLYRAHLMRLEGMEERSDRELRDSELFWNRIMMEHAEFIRGLLDPTENQLIDTADAFANDYCRLLKAARDANDRTARGMDVLPLTREFRDFKQAGTQGILTCKISAIILPLLADHVLREANHYIRLLEDRSLERP